MRRVLFRAVILCCIAGAALAAADYTAVERLVDQINPAQQVDVRAASAFVGQTAGELPEDIKHTFWFTILVFLPFLILPQALLLYIIFRYRDRKDGRKAATFIDNHRLEIVWTAVPILALLVVAGPAVNLLYRQELPPLAPQGSSLTVRVVGKQFNWLYDYPDVDISGLNTYPVDLRPYGVDYAQPIQETAAFPVDTAINMTFTSQDVNHAWGVHAFAVRKDCIKDRLNYAWFHPTKIGFYEGQCFELCGADHGQMILTAAVLSAEDFATWVRVHQLRESVQGVMGVVSELVLDDAALEKAIDAFVAKGSEADRLFALRFWITYHYTVKQKLLEVHHLDQAAAQVRGEALRIRERVEHLLSARQAGDQA